MQSATGSDDESVIGDAAVVVEDHLAAVGVHRRDNGFATLVDAEPFGDVGALPVQGLVPAGEEVVGKCNGRVGRERFGGQRDH